MAFAAGSHVWIPDDVEVVIAAVVDQSFSPGAAGKVTTLDGGRSVKLSANDTKAISQMPEQSLGSVEDMVTFKELDEFSILHNLRTRFGKDVIYTNIGRILTSVNPFKQLGIYSPGVMDEYMEKGSRKMPPHVYGVADDAFNAMIDNKRSQSCVVSGESGAGKTEATKVFLQYISEKSKRQSAGKTVAGSKVNAHEMQQKILESNPLMEAFGNAKTVRNDNSSRFGKWIEVQFDIASGSIVGGSIKSYLLEKSRLVNQANDERNYHIFYQFCSMSELDPELKSYNISDATQYHYLNQSEEPCTVVASIDDKEEWRATINAMEAIGITNEQKHEILNVLNIVLTLGNTTFSGTDEAAVETKEAVENVADMLGTTYSALERALIKVDRSNPADPNLVGNHDLGQACDARDAFAKTIYSLLFDWIIAKINLSLGRQKDSEKICTIGVLDIFGFEFFEDNSFEQLCINYTNECLQQFFNLHVFKLEQEQYAKEGIDVTKIEFLDNSNVIQTIDSKAGLLQIIAEELKINNGTDLTLLKKIKAKADKEKDVAILGYAGNKEVKADPELENVFRVTHYAGTVDYRIEQFLEKNRDTVPTLLRVLGEKSKNAFIAGLFKSAEDAGKKKALGMRFSAQLKDLMADLNATEPHYVRCVKPNAEKKNDKFTPTMVLNQLRYAGLLEVCKIRKMGYPVRATFDDFVKRFRPLATKPAKTHTDLIVDLKSQALMTDAGFQVGNTKVFMKTFQSDSLEEARAKALSLHVVRMQRVVRGYLTRVVSRKWKSIRENLRKAIKSREKNMLKTALLNYGSLPYGGKHLAEYKEAKDLMNRIEDEERIARLLTEAMATRDLNQITAALKAAEEKQLGKSKEAQAALQLVKLIEKENACRQALSDAIDAKDEAKMKQGVAEAKSLKIDSDPIVADAEALLKAIERERVCRKNLQDALAKKDVAKIKQFMNQMADMGKADDPLVKEGETIVKETARAAAAIEARKNEAMFKLQKALNERNLQGIIDLEGELIDLGLTNDLTKQAKKLKSALQAEKEMCARLNAEATAVSAKAQTNLGLLDSDIKPLKAAIQDASGVLAADDLQLTSAKEDLVKYEHQIAVQKEITAALTKYGEMKAAANKEKDSAKREALQADMLAFLKESNNRAVEAGAETQAAFDLKEKLNQLQLEIDDKHRQQKEAEIAERKAQLEQTTEDTAAVEANEAKRQELSNTVSDKHKALLTEASDAHRYQLSKYYRIRADEDYVEKVLPEFKAAAAKSKLISQNKPILKSLTRLDGRENEIAVKINRAILQYTGELSATFPATLAQYVLIKGLEDTSLTDEIFLQIMKHIVGNPKEDSGDKAWLLMCMATKTFPPPAEFAPYLLNFFIVRRTLPGLIGNYARLCIVQLDATMELGPTWFKPNIEEIQNYRKRPPILASIYTLDGKHIEYPVTPDMRVAQVLDLIKRREGIEDESEHPTWGMYVSPEEEEEISDPKKRLIRFYQLYNPSKLAHVDLFLDHWKESPEELFQKLCQKYGPEPPLDDKGKKKGVLALPITAAFQAVKFLGFANQKDAPPAPETPWPLPWWTHLGDVLFRMARQKKVPRFIFKRRLLTRNDPIDKWVYLQAVDDIRQGYIPIADKTMISKLAVLALMHEHGYDVVRRELTVPALKDLGFGKYVPNNEIMGAESAANLQQLINDAIDMITAKKLPTDRNDIMNQFVDQVRQSPVYGMNFFYARHSASDKNYVISVDVEGIHVLEEDRTAVKRSFGFDTIKKFGATAEYFWMNIDERPEAENKPGYFKFLSPSQGINVLLYTLQSWELYDCVYDATHIDVEDE